MPGQGHDTKQDELTSVYFKKVPNCTFSLLDCIYRSASSELNGIHMIWEPKGGASTSRSVVIIIIISIVIMIIMPRVVLNIHRS